MYPTRYHRPAGLDEAIGLFTECEDATYLAGGHTLLPTMKQRLAHPSDLIDLCVLPGLRGIGLKDGVVSIGATTLHAEVAVSPIARQWIPALSGLAGSIGDRHVRHRGTIGGSVANNDPAADYPAASLALGATIVTNKRQIAAADYFKGLFDTALEAQEIITQVRFPIPEKAAYEKFRNPASRYAMVGVFVAKTTGGVRVAVTGAGSNGVFRVPAFEAALDKNFAASALDGLSVPASGLASDLHADADYRAHLIGVLAKRAVTAAG